MEDSNRSLRILNRIFSGLESNMSRMKLGTSQALQYILEGDNIINDLHNSDEIESKEEWNELSLSIKDSIKSVEEDANNISKILKHIKDRVIKETSDEYMAELNIVLQYCKDENEDIYSKTDDISNKIGEYYLKSNKKGGKKTNKKKRKNKKRRTRRKR